MAVVAEPLGSRSSTAAVVTWMSSWASRARTRSLLDSVTPLSAPVRTSTGIPPQGVTG
jgi:hypothetical protein